MALNWFKKLKSGLSKSASKVEGAIASITGKKTVDQETLNNIEALASFLIGFFVVLMVLVCFSYALSVFSTGSVFILNILNIKSGIDMVSIKNGPDLIKTKIED